MSHPDKDTARRWLTDAGIDNYECGHCDGTHLSAIDVPEGPLECRVMWQPSGLLLITQIELRPSAVLPLAALAAGLNGELTEMKIHVECLDDEPPGLVISHALPSFIPLSRPTFIDWISWYVSETQRVIEDVRQTGLLGPADAAPAGGSALH